jgi:hypothetical protein
MMVPIGLSGVATACVWETLAQACPNIRTGQTLDRVIPDNLGNALSPDQARPRYTLGTGEKHPPQTMGWMAVEPQYDFLVLKHTTAMRLT